MNRGRGAGDGPADRGRWASRQTEGDGRADRGRWASSQREAGQQMDRGRWASRWIVGDGDGHREMGHQTERYGPADGQMEMGQLTDRGRWALSMNKPMVRQRQTSLWGRPAAEKIGIF